MINTQDQPRRVAAIFECVDRGYESGRGRSLLEGKLKQHKELPYFFMEDKNWILKEIIF